jgi:hypothetical protein
MTVHSWPAGKCTDVEAPFFVRLRHRFEPMHGLHGLAPALIEPPVSNVTSSRSSPALGPSTMRRVAAAKSIDGLVAWSTSARRLTSSRRVPAGATKLLRSIHSVTSPFEPEVLEGGDHAEKGSERMRASIAVDIEREANGLYIEVIRDLAVPLAAVRHLAQAVLASPGHNLAGAELTVAIEEALET